LFARPLRAGESLRLGGIEPAESGDVINAAGFQSKDDFGKVEALHFR